MRGRRGEGESGRGKGLCSRAGSVPLPLWRDCVGAGPEGPSPSSSPYQGGPMNLGHKMRQMRQMRGLTAVALAKQARVTPGFISQLEYSQTVPSLQTLQRVAAALDVSLTYFLLEESRQPQVVRQRQ